MQVERWNYQQEPANNIIVSVQYINILYVFACWLLMPRGWDAYEKFVGHTEKQFSDKVREVVNIFFYPLFASWFFHSHSFDNVPFPAVPPMPVSTIWTTVKRQHQQQQQQHILYYDERWVFALLKFARLVAVVDILLVQRDAFVVLLLMLLLLLKIGLACFTFFCHYLLFVQLFMGIYPIYAYIYI